MATDSIDAPVLDLTESVSELIAAHPELKDFLTELGLDLSAGEKTIMELADAQGIDRSIVGMAIGACGYDIAGFEPAKDAPEDPFEALVQRMSTASRVAAGSSVDPMVQRIEYAIQRAEEEGRLPKTDKR